MPSVLMVTDRARAGTGLMLASAKTDIPSTDPEPGQSHLGIEVGRSLLIAVAHGVVDAPTGSEIAITLPAASAHLIDGETEHTLFHGFGRAAAA